MNNKASAAAAIFFLVVFGIEVARISGSFVPSSQQISQIGISLFGKYVIPFELLSLILVAGIIGMFYIAGRED